LSVTIDSALVRDDEPTTAEVDVVEPGEAR
jgi:hypothetical protein